MRGALLPSPSFCPWLHKAPRARSAGRVAVPSATAADAVAAEILGAPASSPSLQSPPQQIPPPQRRRRAWPGRGCPTPRLRRRPPHGHRRASPSGIRAAVLPGGGQPPLLERPHAGVISAALWRGSRAGAREEELPQPSGAAAAAAAAKVAPRWPERLCRPPSPRARCASSSGSWALAAAPKL